MTYPPQPPHDPYGRSGPQYPQAYPQHYQVQPYQPAWQAPQYGPVQWVTVRERGFNPTAFVTHLLLWLLVHWWLAGCTLGLWLIAAIPLTFIGWNVTRTFPVQNVYHPR
jgi:hypothetical protein